MPSDDSWKKRYNEELEAASAREKAWEEQRHTFERLLVRTSFASEGQHPDLDRLLRELRDQLRQDDGDIRQLRRIQETLDQQLVSLDESRGQAGKRLKTSLDHLLATIRRHPLFIDEKAELKKLSRALGDPETFQAGLGGWLAQLAELESRALAGGETGAGDTGKEGGRQGVLSRFFGSRRAEAEAESGPPMPGWGDVVDSLPVRTTDLGAPEFREEADQRTRFAHRLGELLENLLSQVSLAPEAHAKVSLIRSQLAERHEWNDLREALNETSELVLAAVSRGQQEFESFLKRLDDRLLALQTHFVEQSEASESRQSASEALESNLNRDLRALQENFAHTDDVTELKQSVSRHVESIIQSVKGYREQESEREALAAEQMAAMQEKLAAMEIQSEQTREQLRLERSRALTDVLTQLPNREAWQERLIFERDRWQRYGHPVTLGILDIDHFKRVNDSYGHKAGDRVIQLLAKALQERLRTTDFIARYGGEEFVLLLPETDLVTARKVIDSLRQHVSGLPFHFQGRPVTITFSAGLAPFQAGIDLESVFDQADRALYRAKDAGRNQIVLAADQ
ncbi:diguanylate cyclase [Marinobacter sp.]|uniref:diguanylate cyclase n=1 Tax=Marinobacter sp. TaxID=50741 RepID=UPI00384C1F3E